MEFNWQEASYVATTLGMIVISLVGILCLWIFYNVLKLTDKLAKTVEESERVIDELNYFQKGLRLGIIRFLLKIIGKGEKNG